MQIPSTFGRGLVSGWDARSVSQWATFRVRLLPEIFRPGSIFGKFDQLQNLAVGILEAHEPGRPAAHLHGLDAGEKLHTLRLKPLILLVDILGMKGDARNAGVPQVRVGVALGFGYFPLDKVDARGAWIVTQDEQRRLAPVVGNPQPLFECLVAALADKEGDFEPQHLVKGERAVEILDVDVDVKDRLDHKVLPSRPPGAATLNIAPPPCLLETGRRRLGLASLAPNTVG